MAKTQAVSLDFSFGAGLLGLDKARFNTACTDGNFLFEGDSLPLGDLTQAGATAGQVPQWNGTSWAPASLDSDDIANLSSTTGDTVTAALNHIHNTKPTADNTLTSGDIITGAGDGHLQASGTQLSAVTGHIASTDNPHATTLQHAYTAGDGTITETAGKPLVIKGEGTTTAKSLKIQNSAGTDRVWFRDDGAVHLYGPGNYSSGAALYFGDGGDTTAYVGIGELVDDQLFAWSPELFLRSTYNGKNRVYFDLDGSETTFYATNGSTVGCQISAADGRLGVNMATITSGSGSGAALQVQSNSAAGDVALFRDNGGTTRWHFVMPSLTSGRALSYTETGVTDGNFMLYKGGGISVGNSTPDRPASTDRGIGIGYGTAPSANPSANYCWVWADSANSGDLSHRCDSGQIATIQRGLLTHTDHTSGGSVSLLAGRNSYDPATLQAAATLTLPSAPPDKTEVSVVLGGTIAVGSDVVTALTVTGAQTVFADLTGPWKGGDSFKLTYNSTKTRWEKI